MMNERKSGDDARTGAASAGLADVATLARDKGSLSIAEIVSAMGPAGIAFTILVLALPALTPIPGPFGMVFGSALAFVALQMAAGRKTVWLPGFLGNRRLSARIVDLIVRHALPFVARVERVVRPGRFQALTGRAVQTLLGIPIFLLAVTIALPIPFGNFVPVLAVMILAVGLMERDGLITLCGLMTTGLAIGLTIFLIYGTASLFTGFVG